MLNRVKRTIHVTSISGLSSLASALARKVKINRYSRSAKRAKVYKVITAYDSVSMHHKCTVSSAPSPLLQVLRPSITLALSPLLQVCWQLGSVFISRLRPWLPSQNSSGLPVLRFPCLREPKHAQGWAPQTCTESQETQPTLHAYAHTQLDLEL